MPGDFEKVSLNTSEPHTRYHGWNSAWMPLSQTSPGMFYFPFNDLLFRYVIQSSERLTQSLFLSDESAAMLRTVTLEEGSCRRILSY